MSLSIFIAPDSFKGTLNAASAAEATAAGLNDSHPDWQTTMLPLADGGEGTLACVAAARGGRYRRHRLTGIHGEPIRAPWLELADGTAVVESARVLGLPLVGTDGPPLQQRGSAALGALLRAILDRGADRIVVGLGGSACNDGGLGLLQTLGAEVRDESGRPVTPDLAGLMRANDVSLARLDPRLRNLELRILCDVDNPLLGDTGATLVYGPQKGLDANEIVAVERAMARFAAACGAPELTSRPGAGAAGGLGFALACLGGRLLPGARELIALSGLAEALRPGTVVVTGEGRSDGQTLAGKLPAMVAQTARERGARAFLLSGDIEAGSRAALAENFNGCVAVAEIAGGAERAMRRPRYWLRRAACELAALIDDAADTGR